MVIPILQMLKVKMKSYSLSQRGFSASIICLQRPSFGLWDEDDQGEEMDDTHKRLRKHLNKAPAIP